MTDSHPGSRWLSRVERGRGPIYRAILDALESAIRSGELQPGDQLPPQRAVAQRLGVDFTTVTRAYSDARARGWVEGAVGRGTFVSARALDDDAGLVDLSMNLPPPPAGLSLGAMLSETTAAMLRGGDAARLMAYHPGAGAAGQQAAGAAWLAPCLGPVAPDRVLVSSGAQTALAAILNIVAPPGSSVVVEPLTYPGFKQLAAHAGVTLIPCPVDDQGVRPDDLERIVRRHAPSALYLIPTLQNPTAATMPLGRRREVARLATAHGLSIIEDDPYSRLQERPLPAIATLAPARTWYVATLAKCLSPGLRVAYVVCPDAAAAEAMTDSLRAISQMPPPLMAAIVTRWIRDGTAEQILAAIREEARARRRLAHDLLPQSTAAADESIHVWLDLPADRHPENLRLSAERRGLSLVTAESFAVGPGVRSGVRISLGAPRTREVLADALRGVAELLA